MRFAPNWLRLVLLGTLLSVLLLARAQAQRESPDTAVVHVGHRAIDSAFQAIARTPTAFFRDLVTGNPTRYQLVVLSRRAAAAAELHEQWSDVVWVRAGRAVLRTSRGLRQRRAAGEGEWTGDIRPRAQERVVEAGDVVVVPAGLAHEWRPRGRAPFSYVLLKVRPDTERSAP